MKNSTKGTPHLVINMKKKSYKKHFEVTKDGEDLGIFYTLEMVAEETGQPIGKLYYMANFNAEMDGVTVKRVVDETKVINEEDLNSVTPYQTFKLGMKGLNDIIKRYKESKKYSISKKKGSKGEYGRVIMSLKEGEQNLVGDVEITYVEVFVTTNDIKRYQKK